MQRRCACSDKFWIRRRLLSKADRNLWSQTRRSHNWFPFQIIPTLFDNTVLLSVGNRQTKGDNLPSNALWYRRLWHIVRCCKSYESTEGEKLRISKCLSFFKRGCICYLLTVKKISSQNTSRAVCQGIIDKGVYMEWRNRLENLAFKLAELWQPHCARLAFFCNDLTLR